MSSAISWLLDINFPPKGTTVLWTNDCFQGVYKMSVEPLFIPETKNDRGVSKDTDASLKRTPHTTG